MALPAGAATATITVGVSTDIAGTAGTITGLAVRPECRLVWAATGQPIEDWDVGAIDAAAATLVVLADQDGVVTSGTVAGAPALVAIRSWPMQAVWWVKSAGGQCRKIVRRFPASLLTAGGTLDLDLLPAHGVVPPAVITYAQGLDFSTDMVADLSVGTVTTGAAGTPAAAALTAIGDAYALDLTIPQGDKGDKGDQGQPNVLTKGTVTTGAPGSQADFSITGDAPLQVLNLTIPTGATGAVSAWEYYAAGRPDVVGTLDAAALAWRAAAPSGATFYSTDGPQGAWVWRKRGTSWVCVEGDTGWRKLVTWDAAGAITYGTLPAGIEPAGYAGGIEVRRTVDRVDVVIRCARLTAASSGNIATGFLLYDALNFMPIASADVTRNFVVRANSSGVLTVAQGAAGWASTNLGSLGAFAIAVASFPARPAWPTTLPGATA